MEPCYAMVRQQQFEANDKKILIAIHANVNTFTLLDGYQTLGTSRQVMTECNWGGGGCQIFIIRFAHISTGDPRGKWGGSNPPVALLLYPDLRTRIAGNWCCVEMRHYDFFYTLLFHTVKLCF